MRPSIISDSACLIGLERIQALDILPLPMKKAGGSFWMIVTPERLQHA